jgi:ATP-dependent Lon protease
MRQFRKIPVLTLNNIVFFPNTSLPLYVVDAVYEELIQDAIATNTPVAVALAQNEMDFTDDYPEPYEVCGIGTPLILERMEDGTLKVLMRGTGKIRLIELEQISPYPVYWSEVLQDEPEETKWVMTKLERLRLILVNWLKENVTNEIERNQFISTMNTDKHILDYVCTFLIKDREIRQLLLENNSYVQRVHLVNALIKDNLPFQEDVDVSDAMKDFESIDKVSKCAH